MFPVGAFALSDRQRWVSSVSSPTNMTTHLDADDSDTGKQRRRRPGRSVVLLSP
jgi:hypothetical protein